jgi:hypothetical protein
MRAFLVLFTILCSTLTGVYGQESNNLRGIVVNSAGEPIEGVHITVQETSMGTSTDVRGTFQMMLPEEAGSILVFSHINYRKKTVDLSGIDLLETLYVELEDSVQMLEQVEVTGKEMTEQRAQVSTISLDPIAMRALPVPFQDISKLLVTLPGVSSVNEFSTAYSVRGGNYDENLVYVNNIPVYRPFIIRSGQQEGLSFVNPDLVSNLQFSSGGWQPQYGDGLSSAMNVYYKRPTEFAGSLSVGLLGGSAHVEGALEDGRIQYLVGARHKRTEYLLGTLETEGEYRPSFTDIQGWVNFDLDRERPRKSELGVMLSYARNRYTVEPQSRETTFGTFSDQLRLFVAFDGQDRLQYDTYQGAVKLSHWHSDRFRSDVIVSGLLTREREYFDVESGYRLCNLDRTPGSNTFDECIINLGIGTQYRSGRNLLDAVIASAENRNEIDINGANTLSFGLGYTFQNFNDRLSEYAFSDSANFTTIDYAYSTENDIDKHLVHAYVQNSTEIGNNQMLTLGVRMHYLDINKQWLISPRMQYSIAPGWNRDLVIRAATGLYQQPPFYRELRLRNGSINPGIKAQSSVHNIIGLDYNLMLWQRPFKITTEVYFKYLWNVVPYDIDNVRIRYFGENSATAYAAGVDFRISGEFLPGDESWFSIGLLSTQERIEGSDQGYIPRPSDQALNVNIFFQDHLPINPTYKMSLNLFFATGLPFSPPGLPEFRNSFRGPLYQRIDLGFSKMVYFSKNPKNPMNSLWISAEILNLTAHNNVISFYWVQDVLANTYAVPNSLSARFFNVRFTVEF